MPIPKTITERELWTAAKPLFDLLGTTPKHVYACPTIERDDDMSLHVRFAHVMDPTAEPMDWPEGVTGDDEFAEKTYEVDVLAVTAGDHHVVDEVWPDPTPASTLAHPSGV